MICVYIYIYTHTHTHTHTQTYTHTHISCLEARMRNCNIIISLQMALQPGVGLGLRYNMPSGLSVPCSISIRLYPSFSDPRTRHPAISFLVFLFVLLRTAFRTASFFGIAVSCVLSICPSHLILWHLINLTMFLKKD